MYMICRKSKTEANHYPTSSGEKVSNSKNIRRYRNLDIAKRDFIFLCAQNPEILWTIRDTKTYQSVYSNGMDVLKIWNKK